MVDQSEFCKAVLGQEVLVVRTNTNTHGKHDATGAFIPEAEAFAKVHRVPDENVVGIKLPRVGKAKRRRLTMDAIAKAGANQRLSAIALFGHGWPQGIQFGFNRKHISELVEHMAKYCRPDVCVTLFTCLAAENDARDKNVSQLGPATDGGFADILRDEMVRHGLDFGHVDGHKTKGHTSWNPFLIRFLCKDVDDPEFGAVGGAWIIPPRSELWREWVKALRDKESGLRYRFPFMTETEIRNELLG